MTRSIAAPLPHPVTLTFADRDLERAFLDRFAAEAITRYRFLIGIVTAIWIGFGAFDHIVVSDDSIVTARVIRFGIVLPILLVGLGLSYTSTHTFTRLWQPMLAVGYAAIAAAMIYYVSGVGEPYRTSSAGGLALVIVGGYTLVMMRFVWAAATSAAITAAIAMMHIAQDGVRAVLGGLLPNGMIWIYLANIIGVFACRELELFRRAKFLQQQQIEREQERSESLLRNILPRSIAERLKRGAGTVVDSFESVTVLFGDLVGFTALAERMPSRELVARLNGLYSEFDAIAERYGLEKIKTMGDEYMLVGGVPLPREDHAVAVANMALEMRDAVAARRAQGEQLEIRIGIHTGPVVAGVIGTRKFSYDVWGDTVNVASRMQSHGVPGSIQVSETTYAALRDEFAFESRGNVDIKGKGDMRAYLLTGRRDPRARAARSADLPTTSRSYG